MSYAFRVFAAIYGHRVSEEDAQEADILCWYGQEPGLSGGSRTLHIPALYAARPFDSPTPKLISCKHAGEDFHLFHGTDAATGNPDWLGEIFEWLSCSDELSIAARDSAGRIPYQETLFARQGISPLRPHVSLIMAWLESALFPNRSPNVLPKAPSPVAGSEHLVISSHDVDYYFAGRRSAAARLFKNLAISLLVTKSFSFSVSTLGELLRLLAGQRVGDFLPTLIAAAEKQGFRSSLFLLIRSRHRRDGNYQLPNILPRVREASGHGFAVGLHGSYQSIVEHSDLPAEAETLIATQGPICGGRQHWLRFDRHDKLFKNVERSHFLFDSTLGFSQAVGFRNGACFAFPPYNFEKEQPYEFLEIPLAIMDTALWQASRASGRTPTCLAEQVLNESRQWGWGGIAVLWHNPIEHLSVPKRINDVFWEQLKDSASHQEKWVTAEEFLQETLSRYQDAGLLGSRTRHAELAAS
jgi:hypothetical protein